MYSHHTGVDRTVQPSMGTAINSFLKATGNPERSDDDMTRLSVFRGDSIFLKRSSAWECGFAIWVLQPREVLCTAGFYSFAVSKTLS